MSLTTRIALAVVMAAAVADPSGAEGELPEVVRALIGGKPDVDVRFRWENAKLDGLDESNAVTVRTHLGYGTAPYHGFDAYAQFENVVALERSYFDGIGANSKNRTQISDPETTEVNQGFLRWSTDALDGDGWLAKSGTSLLGGRKRVVLDDARFIGNVVWRQNEQTYDLGLFESGFGVEGLRTTYGYVFEVHRIFGDGGAAGAPTRDFDSDSHIVHLHYAGFAPLAISAFGYLLDFSSSPANSSDTFGLRLDGEIPLGDGDDLSLGYVASYAYQQDTGPNPTDYGAHYYDLEASLRYAPWGSVRLGYEVLGSDHGFAQFRTPLATAHKFNGWADVFLDNGGPTGLRDLFLSVSPRLPWGLSGSIIYHHFESDSGRGLSDRDLGDEIDAVLTRKLYEHLLLLAKFAYYDAGEGGRQDVHRVWLEATLSF